MRMGPPLEPPEPVQGEGGILRYGDVTLWPNVYVDSQAFGKLPYYERLRRLALGFIASSKAQCRELGENPSVLDWPRAAVACYCCYHSIELFLKACILYRSPSARIGVHNVSELKREYHRHYPFDRYFAFSTPWDTTIADIEAAFGMPGAVFREDFEDKPDQVYRYLSDKAGRSPKAMWGFGPGAWTKLAEQFEDDFDRVWGNIQETYPAHIK